MHIKYIICAAVTREMLAYKVNSMVSSGYKPVGGPCAIIEAGEQVYLQAIFLDDFRPENESRETDVLSAGSLASPD